MWRTSCWLEMMYILLTKVKNFISMKYLGKTRIFSVNVYSGYTVTLLWLCQTYIYEILKEFNIETTRNGSCRMERNWIKIQVYWHLISETRFKCFDTWWVKSRECFDQSYHDMYTSRYVLCSKCYEHIPEWIIKWSLDDSEDILMIFWKN